MRESYPKESLEKGFWQIATKVMQITIEEISIEFAEEINLEAYKHPKKKSTFQGCVAYPL